MGKPDRKMEARGKIIKDHHVALRDRWDSWRHQQMHVWFRYRILKLFPNNPLNMVYRMPHNVTDLGKYWDFVQP